MTFWYDSGSFYLPWVWATYGKIKERCLSQKYPIENYLSECRGKRRADGRYREKGGYER